MEGIYTSEEHLWALGKDTTRPKTRDEQEIVGYRDVLNMIHENHEYLPPKPSIILQMHRDLYKFEGFDAGGKYKTEGVIIEIEDYLGNIIAAYKDFSSKVSLLTTAGMSKPDQVKEIIRTTSGPITKREILEKCPNISQITVQRTLVDLTKSGVIKKIGGGRYTKYIWNEGLEKVK